MVKNILILLMLVLAISASAQVATLDDISLMDIQRNEQLLKDSLFKDHSFMMRSTQQFQNNAKHYFGISANYTLQNNDIMPLGFNQGTMYPNVGLQERKSIGLRAKLAFVDINIQPEWVNAANEAPPLFKGHPNDGNYWTRYYFMVQNNIDYYDRFGTKPLNKFFLGQSRIAIRNKNFAVGFSTENLWWGPGIRNSLIMTNEAAGFNHYFIQTNKPYYTLIGSFEANVVAGKLESPEMATQEDAIMRGIWPGAIEQKSTRDRILGGFIISWQPKWFKNFHIGYSYMTQQYKLDSMYPSSPKMNLGAFLFRFNMPKDHAEFYAEIGQPNTAVSPWSFFKDSAKTGFVIGAKKLIPLGSKPGQYLELNAEFTQLQLMNPELVINNAYPTGTPLINSWYTSWGIRQGYTNQGKMIGASIGPGSNSQTIKMSWHKGLNKIGLFFERVANNNDFYVYEYYSSTYSNRYWIDLVSGLDAQLQVSPYLIIAASAYKTKILNYRWVRIDDLTTVWSEPSKFSDKKSFQFTLSLKYRFYASH
jgi:hypothetical protein